MTWKLNVKHNLSYCGVGVWEILLPTRVWEIAKDLQVILGRRGELISVEMKCNSGRIPAPPPPSKGGHYRIMGENQL